MVGGCLAGIGPLLIGIVGGKFPQVAYPVTENMVVTTVVDETVFEGSCGNGVISTITPLLRGSPRKEIDKRQTKKYASIPHVAELSAGIIDG